MDYQKLETRIMAIIMRAMKPVNPEYIRKTLTGNIPMPVVQKAIVNLHIRQVIEIYGRDKQKKTLWRMATK